MRKHSAWIFELLLRVLLPARGRHRSTGALPAARRAAAPMLAPPRVPVRQPGLLRGEDVYLIRPYVLTPEERRERRAQRQRRQVLWLAVHGVDAGPRRIHGVVTA
ncbi:hypothetical protein SSP35_05_00230 [Streptomyces sp. NBRC 110611]|uniref:hypothetical protein n=1 Tax=Streptomyces sp. NBRC 110611 TaxID=1621259 RepID=UPI000858733D|nr:hypothetical protein [Streptomyces sp. NBRC 110611]GAU67456.1 hypothetical protein SSP35_05_00230 [Streptomyces sp. NBRC 110611]